MHRDSPRPMIRGRALVTGGSEGIGRAFARRLAASGYTVTAVARNETRLRSLIAGLSGSGHHYEVSDLSTPAGIARTVELLEKDKFQLLINNAGITHYGVFSEVAWDRQEEILRINCEALVALAHRFLRRAHAGDALLNISSMLAFLPQPTSAMYSATKAFVTAFSEALWYESKARGVYVLGLHPGLTHTKFRSRGGGNATRAPWAQCADDVVTAGMKALAERRHCTVISGGFNQAMAAVSRIVPRQVLVTSLGRSRSRRGSHRD